MMLGLFLVFKTYKFQLKLGSNTLRISGTKSILYFLNFVYVLF